MLMNIKKITTSNFLVNNIDDWKKYAACVMKYFDDSENQVTQGDSSEDLIYKNYKVVLDSKAKDETLVSGNPFF